MAILASLRRKFAHARQLSGAEWRVLLRAWGLLFQVETALRFRPVTAVLHRFVNAATREPSADGLAPARLGYLVGVAARHHPLDPKCLPQAIVLQRILRRRGVESDLTIGTAKDAGALKAHAWVTYQGQVVLGAVGEAYEPLYRHAAGE